MAKRKVRKIEDVQRVKLGPFGPSHTKQHLKDKTDVNQIMERYQRTGLLNEVNEMRAVYADVSDIGTYQDAMEFVSGVMDEFMDLPSKIRDRFKNDPQALVAFLSNPEHREEAIELGLVERPIVEEPSAAAPASTPAVKEKPAPDTSKA